MSVRTKIFAIIVICCIIFAWMAVPFITVDKMLLRKQVMFVDNLQEQIVADSSATIAIN